MIPSFCSDDFKVEPFWWAHTPRRATAVGAVPSETDVLVIGSGYTGLHCALQTADAGRQTTVIDAQDAGWGCSTRNGGQISGEIKPDYSELQIRFGSKAAFAIVKEARDALAWLGEFVESHRLDCDYRRCGRYLAAHSPRQFKKLVARAQQQRPGMEQRLRVIEKPDQASEIDSDFYHGGLVIEDHCALNPAAYHQSLLGLVQASGTDVISHCAATDISPAKGGFEVHTRGGTIKCRELVVATNGYTSSLTPWLHRRIIPIGSYMLATEAMDLARSKTLMPQDRVFSDTRRVVVYFRRSPDGARLLFGGRVSVFETDPMRSLPALRQEMLRIFPQLEDVKISHSWMGLVGYSFDSLPHLGVRDGIHYAMGYCGSGICLASFLGHRLGLQLLGEAGGQSVFTNPVFETRPFYRGKPWFLAGAVGYYQWLDRFG